MTEDKQMTTLDKIENIDPRYIYLVLFILVGGLLAFPIGLPVEITPLTIGMRDYIDNLPPGSNVLWGQVYPAGAKAEQLPQATVVAKYLIEKGHNIISFSFREDGPVLDDWAWKLAIGEEKFDEIYGFQLVNLGYVPGRGVALRAFAQDSTMIKTDFYGNDVSTLPIMEGIETAADFDVACVTAGSFGWFNNYLRYVQTPYGTPVIGCVQASIGPSIVPYYPDAIPAYILGLRGAREFEMLISPGKPIYNPSLAGMMDALSIGFLYLILMILGTNIIYFIRRSQGGGS